jgi:hypothetical protein
MTYTSPFSLFDLGAGATFDKSTLNLAKKKILAELDLSTHQTIVLAGQEMTKNDVLQLFDALGKSQDLEYHQAIAKDAVLLHFLEKGTINENSSFLHQAIYDNPNFIDFVSPYFSEQYSTAIINALTENNNKKIANLLTFNPLFLNASDTYKTWEEVESFIVGEMKAIDEAAEQVERHGVKTREEVMHFYDYRFLGCLNRLPEHFASVRDRYARALYNLATVQWNKGQHQNAVEIVKEATLLNTYPETQTMMQERLSWFNTQLDRASNTSTNSSSTSSSSNSGNSLWYIIAFIITLLRFGATCNRLNTRSSYDNSRSSSSAYRYAEEAAPAAPEEDTEMSRARDWAESYLSKEKEKLNKLYLSEKRDKKVIRQLAKNQLALYQKAKLPQNALKREVLAKAISRNLVWLYNYGESSDAYIGELADWFAEESDIDRTFKKKVPKE